jgi:hypothetical protein
MNVVGDATNAKAFASRVTSDCGEVGVESGADGGGEDGNTVFRAEDEMDDDKGERLRHGRKYSGCGRIDGSGLQPSGFVSLTYLGRCPRLRWKRAVGAKSLHGANVNLESVWTNCLVTPSTQPNCIPLERREGCKPAQVGC